MDVGAARVKKLPHMEQVSTTNSAVYLYSSTHGIGASTDEEWDEMLRNDPELQTVIDSQAHQDRDYQIYYNKGPTLLLMIQSTIKIGDKNISNSSYTVIDRTYPGMSLNNTYFDPTERDWFKHSPENGYFLSAPYLDEISNQPVIAISSRIVSDALYPRPVTITTGAILHLHELRTLMKGFVLVNDGCAALLTYASLDVIYWQGDVRIFGPLNSTIPNITSVDSNLAKK